MMGAKRPSLGRMQHILGTLTGSGMWIRHHVGRKCQVYEVGGVVRLGVRSKDLQGEDPLV